MQRCCDTFIVNQYKEFKIVLAVEIRCYVFYMAVVGDYAYIKHTITPEANSKISVHFQQTVSV